MGTVGVVCTSWLEVKFVRILLFIFDSIIHRPNTVHRVIQERQTTAKAFNRDVSVDQERKLGDQRRLDTVRITTRELE